MDWAAAVRALRQLDDEAWDLEYERLTEKWRKDYQTAFVACALSRPGWDRDNAEAWASDVVGDAHSSCMHQGLSPEEVAEVDVAECEQIEP